VADRRRDGGDAKKGRISITSHMARRGDRQKKGAPSKAMAPGRRQAYEDHQGRVALRQRLNSRAGQRAGNVPALFLRTSLAKPRARTRRAVTKL